MHLAPLEISEDEARDKLAEYEKAVRTDRNAEDEAIAMGYRAAARGLPVIALPAVIRAGGWFPDGMPRIAISRATSKQCAAKWDGNHLLFTDGDLYTGWRQNRGALVNEVSVRVPIPGDDKPKVQDSWRWHTTVVPLVPPRYRPRRPRRLSRCHVLWEVEKWDPTPPRDPALLRHIRGDLWAVLAVWDLTDLERHVLSQR